MSNFNGHRNAGVVASIAVGIGAGYITRLGSDFDIKIIAISMVTTFLFSLFPDIDIKSTPSKWFYWAITIILGYCYYTGKHTIGNLLGLIAITPQLTKHRGVFHSPITAVILPGLIFYMVYLNLMSIKAAFVIYIAAIIGYFTHLLLDRK